MEESKYTANLTQGLGLIDETLAILELWTPGMSSAQLNEVALKSGLFSSMTARRLRNIVTEVIKSRYLTDEARPARLIKMLVGKFDKRVVSQMMYYYTCLANRILFDFVKGRPVKVFPELYEPDQREEGDRVVEAGGGAKREHSVGAQTARHEVERGLNHIAVAVLEDGVPGEHLVAGIE